MTDKLDEFLKHLGCSCSDGGCIFRPSDATGLVTNGGCKCAGDREKRIPTQRLINWLKREYYLNKESTDETN